MAPVFAYHSLLFLVFSWHFLGCQTSPLSAGDVRVPRENSEVPGSEEEGKGDTKTEEEDDFVPYTYIIEYTRTSDDDTLASASRDDAPVQLESHAHASSSSTSHQPRLVSEDVTKKVAIYIEEGYDRGAYDHRGYDKVSKGWDDHLEYDHKRYGGETTSGDEARDVQDHHDTTRKKLRTQEPRDLHPRFSNPQDVVVPLRAPPPSRPFRRPRPPSFRLLPPPPLPVRKDALPRSPPSKQSPHSPYARGRTTEKGGERSSRERERGEREDFPEDVRTPFEFVLPEDLRSYAADLESTSDVHFSSSRDRGAPASHPRGVPSQRSSAYASAAASRGNDEVLEYISNADPDDPHKPWYAIVTRKATGGEGGRGKGVRGRGKEGRGMGREEIEGGERKGREKGDRHRTLSPPDEPDVSLPTPRHGALQPRRLDASPRPSGVAQRRRALPRASQGTGG